MNRRKFCQHLALAPVAAAVAAALPASAEPLIHMGNQTGRWSSGCLYPYQRDALRHIIKLKNVKLQFPSLIVGHQHTRAMTDVRYGVQVKL